MLITKLVAIFVESNKKEFLVQVLENQMKNERAFIELLCCLKINNSETFLSLKPSVLSLSLIFFFFFNLVP